MPLHSRALPAGFIAPCLATSAAQPPSGELWLHEIKHDGFRVIARKSDNRVRLYSRPGNDLTRRFPLIVEALARLRPRSCIIDGEAVACGDDGIASFDRIRYRHHDVSGFCAAITRCPAWYSLGIMCRQCEPSPNAPCTRTMLSLSVMMQPPRRAADSRRSRPRSYRGPSTRSSMSMKSRCWER
jgi:hypothetical protein